MWFSTCNKKLLNVVMLLPHLIYIYWKIHFKTLAIFTGKYLCWNNFFKKRLHHSCLDSITAVFLLSLRNFYKRLFLSKTFFESFWTVTLFSNFAIFNLFHLAIFFLSSPMAIEWHVFIFFIDIGHSTLVRQRLWNHCRPCFYPFVRPSVTKFSQDWVISFFWYCPWW